MSQPIHNMPRKYLDCGRYRLPLPAAGERPLVMGILNVTPNSFSDGGHFYHLEAALSRAEQMIADGADLIDIGAESTRPGAPVVPVDEELRRLMPVLYALRDCGKPISIDTNKPEVMREVLAAGADMINDINAFQAPGALDLLADSDCGLCIMHMQGTPQTMQQAPAYEDVSAEVTHFLRSRVDAALAAGIARSRLCIDPGFGFGKTHCASAGSAAAGGDVAQIDDRRLDGKRSRAAPGRQHRRSGCCGCAWRGAGARA